MAYERYSTRSGKLMIVLRVWHNAVVNKNTVLCSPTRVEILDVLNEKAIEVKYVEFEAMIADKRLTRIN